MLIPSQRHTKSDLELWTQHEGADLEHFDSVRTKTAEAIREIKKFGSSPCYCSTSWGKDSVVIAHLCHLAGSKAPLGHLVITSTASPNPHSYDVASRYIEKTGQQYVQRPGRAGFQHDFKELDKAMGATRVINGVRSEEATERAISRAVHGKSTDRVCRPIIDWSTQDVFAYLAGHRLPVHPAYAMLGGGRYDRRWIRVASIGGERGGGMGRREWEREYYSDVLAKINSISHF